MLRTIKHLITTFQKSFLIALATALILIGISPAPALAQGPQAWGGVCVYEARDQDDQVITTVATIQGLQCLIANVLGIAVTIIGLIAFAVFIIAGFQIMLSGGNSKGLEAAKGSMTYAVVGLVVALSAFIILNLISAFTGVNFTTFIIPAANPI